MLSSLRARFKPQPPALLPQGFDVDVGGQTLFVTLKTVARAKRMTLKVQAATGAIILTAPPRISLKKAQDFVSSHGAWLVEKRSALPHRIALTDGAVFPLRGQDHRIHATHAARGIVTVRPAVDPESAVEMFFLDVPGAAPHHGRKILDFLKKEARKDLEEATHRYAATLQVPIGKISIKDTKSRWGSCSSKGDLAFSFRLILAPPFVLDYVAAHEVAHRREMNHGPRFWALLHSMTPHVESAELWLKKNGAALHRYA